MLKLQVPIAPLNHCNEQTTMLTTTLAVWRPARQQWTTLFEHEPYGAALWALLFDADEGLSIGTSERIAGYQTTVGQARDRLVARLGPIRYITQVWRSLSLARALALSLAPIPSTWRLRFDARAVMLDRSGERYEELLAAAVAAASELATYSPNQEREAFRCLLAMTHGMNPETPLSAPLEYHGRDLQWTKDSKIVEYALLGKPVDCPTSHVESMTSARRQWQARW